MDVGIRLNQALRLGGGWYRTDDNDTQECSQESREPREWEAKMAGVTQESETGEGKRSSGATAVGVGDGI